MIIIIGAGLSGLLTAYRLKQKGIPFKIMEARTRVGGRINTVYGTNDVPIEMGATWFNSQHRNLIALLEELEINAFEQFMDSTVFYQPSPTSSVQSIQIPSQPPSYRISGGTSQLIHTLFNKLDQKDIFLNQVVTDIRFKKNIIEVSARETFTCAKVVLAIPPKLWAKNISFTPPLPEDLMQIASQTHTWMEDSIKVALTYERPFWGEKDNIGTLFSNSGPITELYDHCNHQRSKYALCGFINSAFNNLKPSERRALVIQQIKTVFGTKAEDFIDYKECAWRNEEHTFEASEKPLFAHQNNGNPIFRKAFFDDKLLISSSESASEFPGYMDGAVSSAELLAKKITEIIALEKS